MGGFFLPDKDLSNKDSTIEGIEPTGGLRLGVNFARHFDWFMDSVGPGTTSEWVSLFGTEDLIEDFRQALNRS